MSLPNTKTEEYFPGGFYDINDEQRTDVSIQRSTMEPETYQLHFVSGNFTFCSVEMSPKRLIEFADWLKGVVE